MADTMDDLRQIQLPSWLERSRIAEGVPLRECVFKPNSTYFGQGKDMIHEYPVIGSIVVNESLASTLVHCEAEQRPIAHIVGPREPPSPTCTLHAGDVAVARRLRVSP